MSHPEFQILHSTKTFKTFHENLCRLSLSIADLLMTSSIMPLSEEGSIIKPLRYENRTVVGKIL